MILGALVLFVLPALYLDGLLADRRQALAVAAGELGTLRQQAQAVQEREQQLSERQQRLSGLDARLLGAQPLSQIDRTVREAAQRSGISVGRVSMEGPDSVPERSDLDRYTVHLKVAGFPPQYLAFLQALEEHSLLIELPEVAVKPQPGPGAQIQQEITLGFYARVMRKSGIGGTN